MRNVLNSILLLAITFGWTSVSGQQSKPPQIESWITNPDRSMLFARQTDFVSFADKNSGRGTAIVIDDLHQLQPIDGFGFALTGGSAGLLMKMEPAERKKILNELFSATDDNIGVSYLRLSIGASDLNSFVYSYDDLPVNSWGYTKLEPECDFVEPCGRSEKRSAHR
jgi:glucosylceramidase